MDEPTVTREQFIKNQRKYCNEHAAPFFMPGDGLCYRCKKDIIAVLIEGGKTGAEKLVTGCPICFRSYCD